MNEYLPRGMNFARRAIARGMAGDGFTPVTYAAQRWGAKSRVVSMLKAAVTGGSTETGDWGAELADARADEQEFLEIVRPMTILGKLQGLRRVPLRTPYVATTQGVTAYWRGQSKAAKVSRMAFQREQMTPLNIAALLILSNELLRSSSPEAEMLILNDLARATAELTDMTFIDRGNAGTANVMPAAINYGSIEIASTGNIADDIEAMLGGFSGSLETASFVLHPRLAASIGLRSGGKGVAADLGARGGSLAGLPAIVSESCALDSDGTGDLTLIDAGSICFCDTGATVTRSDEATVEVDDNPSGDASTPTASSQTLVGLWQTESVGLLVSRDINWRLARGSSVVTLTGAGYYAAS